MDAPKGHPDAVVRPAQAEQAIRIERLAPLDASLAEFIDYHWFVGWQTPQPHDQRVVPRPHIHLAAEHGRLLVHGISREPFVRTLTGTGHTLGASFHAGGFRPFLRRSVGSVSGSVTPAGDLLGADDRATAADILAADEVRVLVEAAESDHAMHRAEELAAQASMSLRSLQRLFTEYVGVGPKWVVSRFRILDAAAAAHTGDPVDWAELATALGFSDQAHLTRAFTSVVGTPPATYQREA